MYDNVYIICPWFVEYMPGGSMHDFLHQKKGVLSFPSLLRVAVDVSKGMNYLHQKNIIHRDLKAANLLLDEDGVRNKFFAFNLVIFW